MARLRLTIHNVSYFKENNIPVVDNLSLSTDKESANIWLATDTDLSKKVNYNLNLVDFNFQKKMYQPTEVIAKIQISLPGMDQVTTEEEKKAKWQPVSKSMAESLFSKKKVSLTSLAVNTTNNDYIIGNDFYVDQVKVHYKSTAMYVTLMVYSLDKLLTDKIGSQTFVSKKLKDQILPEILKGITAPYDSGISVAGNCDNMQVLKYDKTEHIFPYLVQYNESAYDMLARTANRWGEFMFYENGKLNIGYDASQTVSEISDWADLDYFDLESTLKSDEANNTYDAEAAYDQNIVDNPLQKDPDVVKNLAGCSFKNGLDVWIMKQVASFLGNNKNIPTWLGNQLFNEAYDRILANKNSNTVNQKIYDDYFKEEEVKEKYGMHKFKDIGDKYAFNPFTELHSIFNETKYRYILGKELAAGQNAVRINFDTTCPNLQLGQVFTIPGNKNDSYIVNEIVGRFEEVIDYSVKNYTDVIVTRTTKLVFEVIGLANSCDDKDELFYPLMLPTGHIRISGPQIAKVFDADDPSNQNRVRILFPWQNLDAEQDPKKKEPYASPWLVYATSAASKSNGIFGKHYVGDEVIVNFANGNIENPYVVGGLATQGNKVPGSLAERDIVLSSPGGHTLRMDDGSSAGLTAFLAGAVFPGYEILTTFLPSASGFDFTQKGSAGIDEDTSKRFEGGFQLTDKYGVYTISGSTDERNVSIKSPWGDVNINAFTGISISAPNGDIEIKGKNVKIEAGNNLELVSGTNIGNSWRPHKDTIGGGLAQVGTDIMAAVTKKLAEKFFTLVDLSILRSMVEIIVRPIEGATVVKSNRFLKLEAGEDECTYPETGYKSIEIFKEEVSKKELKQGLSLARGVANLISKTKAIASYIDDDFRSRYNDCVKKHNSFKRAVNNARRYANGYKSNHDVAICKTLVENKNTFWAPGAYETLVDDKLGFKEDIYGVGIGDVGDDAIEVYWGSTDTTRWSEERKKRPIINARINHRRKILSAANDLRKAICHLMNIKELTKQTINSKIGWNSGYSSPKDYKDVMTEAFSKGKLGDSYYYKDFTDDQKALANELKKADTLKYRKALRRKAAINLLEGLGFQDDWRSAVAHVLERTDDGIVKAEPWADYADSLVAFPPLEAKKLALTQAISDAWDDVSINPVAVKREYDVWSNSKNGSVLFTHAGNTYELGHSIGAVQNNFPHQVTNENALDHLEEGRDGKGVKNALKKIKNALKGI